MKVGNKIFLFLMVGLLCLTVVSAVKPTTTVNENGYQLFISDFETIKQHSNYKTHIHLSNISNGLPLVNTDADCFIHIYDDSGNHTFKGQLGLDSNGYEWDLFIAPGNFSKLGQHFVYIWCNSSDFGGEAKGSFEVVSTGIASGFVGSLGFYIILLILSLGIIILGYSVEDEWIIMLGAFGLLLLGLFIILYGLVGIKDDAYTYSFGIITMLLGAYFAVRAGLQKIGESLN